MFLKYKNINLVKYIGVFDLVKYALWLWYLTYNESWELNSFTTIESIGTLVVSMISQGVILSPFKYEHLCSKEYTEKYTILLIYLIFFLWSSFESESIHKTCFARLLIEWRKSEDFCSCILGLITLSNRRTTGRILS